MKSTAHNYELVKYYADGRPPEVQTDHTRLALQQAQDACNAPSTRKAGEWFIGYREINSPKREALGNVRRGTASITKALIHSSLGAGRAAHGQWD